MSKHESADETQSLSEARRTHSEVPADLSEQTPAAGGALFWALASPLLLFLAWVWIDVLAFTISPTGWIPADILLAFTTMGLFALPAGAAAHRLVTSVPWLFHHAGWDIQPLEHVNSNELHSVKYTFRARNRAENTWSRWWLRAAQGWVYIEIAVIFLGAALLIPLFLSVSRYGFGR